MSDTPTAVTDEVNIGTAFDLIGRKRENKPRPFACCPSDREPLISTMRWSGAEFYCQVCKRHYGFLSPVPGEPTDELDARHKALQAQFDAEFKAGE